MSQDHRPMYANASAEQGAVAIDPPAVPLRSEAFAEDVFEFVERAQAIDEPVVRWATGLAPLAVALIGVAFAVVPPLG